MKRLLQIFLAQTTALGLLLCSALLVKPFYGTSAQAAERPIAEVQSHDQHDESCVHANVLSARRLLVL